MRVIVTSGAGRDFKKLPRNQQLKIKKKLILLQSNPFCGKMLSGKYEKYDVRSLKAWPYRIIYHFDHDNRNVWVDSIVHRQGAYK